MQLCDFLKNHPSLKVNLHFSIPSKNNRFLKLNFELLIAQLTLSRGYSTLALSASNNMSLYAFRRNVFIDPSRKVAKVSITYIRYIQSRFYLGSLYGSFTVMSVRSSIPKSTQAISHSLVFVFVTDVFYFYGFLTRSFLCETSFG